jgi:diaminopimelate decarboxylase
MPGMQHSIAIKTNPQIELLRTLVSWGYGLEAASIEEVRRAKKAGCPLDRIVFDSPVKTRLEIAEVAYDTGMLVNVNTIAELERFPADATCVLGIRINPQVHAGSPEMFDVSKNESKFGVPISNHTELIRAAIDFPVGALHIHSGSQMQNLEAQKEALIGLRDLALSINEQSPGKIHTLDIGGGLPTEAIEGQTKMSVYGLMVQEIFRGTPFKLVTEFGQWVHASAGFAISTIEYVVQPDRVFVHLGADFFMRDAYTKARPFPLAVISAQGRWRSGEARPFDIAGPLCFAGDYLAHKKNLPGDLQESDYLVIDETGANTYALWSRHCSRDVPSYWAWDGNSIVKWAERQTIVF